jgi:hypothetical protein
MVGSKPMLQARYLSSHLKVSERTSVIIQFSNIYTGEIIGCRYNCPGSWHDARVAENIYDKLSDRTPDDAWLVSDTAFPNLAGKIKKPMKAGQHLHGTPAEIAELVAFDNELLSCRQAAEWGMRTIQGSFGRLKLPLPADRHRDREVILELCTRLTNVRVRTVGVSQIKSVYLPEFEKREDDQFWNEVADEFYGPAVRRDRISRYRLQVQEE